MLDGILQNSFDLFDKKLFLARVLLTVAINNVIKKIKITMQNAHIVNLKFIVAYIIFLF